MRADAPPGAVTYSGISSWYYEDTRHLNALSMVWFAFYLSFQQAYFMGLMFLLAGYFVAHSYDRRGAGGFAVERLRRLGTPTVIYMVVITPFIGLVELHQPWTGFDLLGFLTGTGPMWFAAALLIFSLICAGVRLLFPGVRLEPLATQVRPRFRNLALLALVIAVLAFMIRIVQPIGTSVLNMQLCLFASYVVLFGIGIVASRGDLLRKLSYRAGKWLLIGAAGHLRASLLRGRVLRLPPDPTLEVGLVGRHQCPATAWPMPRRSGRRCSQASGHRRRGAR